MTARLLANLGRIFTLPLLARELTEASARRRTYVIRSVYASLLFIAALIFTRNVIFAVGDRFNVLGRGDGLFIIVAIIQIAGIYLFLPAMTCASITSEKERNTLGMLFLTRLTPTKIIVEKYLGRVFPMLSLMLLSLPLFGISYTLGGLEAYLIWEGIIALFVTTLLVGAVGIAASAWCRTTAGAFFLTYMALAVLFPGPLLIFEPFNTGPGRVVIKIIGAPFLNAGLLVEDNLNNLTVMLFPPAPLITKLVQMNNVIVPGVATTGRSVFTMIWTSMPALFATLCILGFARFALVRRADVKPKHYMLRFFRRIDRHFRDINDHFAYGIEIVKTRNMDLGDDPIAWRECTKTVFGAFRYLVRLLLVVEVPVLFIAVIAAGGNSRGVLSSVQFFAGLLWLGGCFLIAAKGATLFPAERARETLGVLLTTTLPTGSILRQKTAGLWRLVAVCCVPVITMFWAVAYLGDAFHMQSPLVAVLGVVSMICAMAASFAMVAWLSILVGMRIPRSSKAVLASISLVVAICVAGPLIYLVISQDPEAALVTGSPFSLYSPLSVLCEAMMMPWQPVKSLILIAGTLLIYGGLAFVLRNLCYRNAAAWLGRGDEDAPPKTTPEQPSIHQEPAREYEVAGL